MVVASQSCLNDNTRRIFYGHTDGTRAEGRPRSAASLPRLCASEDRVGALGRGRHHAVLEGVQFGPPETDAPAQKGLEEIHDLDPFALNVEMCRIRTRIQTNSFCVHLQVTFWRKFKRQFYLNTLGMVHAALIIQVLKQVSIS